MADPKTIEELSDALERAERAIEIVKDHPSKGLTKHIGTIITVVALGIGGVGAFYTNQATVSELKADNEQLESKILRLESTVHDVELRAAQDSSDLRSLKEGMQEIKQDVKTIKDYILNSR